MNEQNSVPAIEVEHLTVSYGPTPALLDVSFSIEAGQLVGVIGPNGSGKSTLIKSILGFQKADFGKVKIFGESADKAIGKVAYVPQRGAVDWDFPITVLEVAMMGRYGQLSWWRDPSKKDRQIAMNALEMVRMTDFAHRQIGQLSGGQQQRVFMARAMAQGAEILLLDEPFAGVDAATERAILDVLYRTKVSGKTLVVVHHDLATAAEYFDQLILLKQRLYGIGTPQAVLHPELLSEVYEGKLKSFQDLIPDETEKQAQRRKISQTEQSTKSASGRHRDDTVGPRLSADQLRPMGGEA
ncbi:High-affinity zinc uptake system ATP-binding protein ZnuC [Planctomycetales bacterium 10988]|nr:High-affinity zinc uptake system ATP-binding protein ZnuC [Planctomycetales bacterium 10988]